MIYIVECGFSDPAREQAWNDYYTGQKLGEVLAVPGFRTSQRFKALSKVAAPYFAMHSVDSLEVFSTPAYSKLGGGRFDTIFQPCITNWVRSFYNGLDRVPAYSMDDLLVVCDQPEKAEGAGIVFTWLTAATPDLPVKHRGIARIRRQLGLALMQTRRDGLAYYEPMMGQRREAPGKPTL